jgi:hypothetical protein
MRFFEYGLLILLVSPLATAAHSQQDSSSATSESLADAARRAQARKQDQAKATKVWDNDNIPTSNSNISVVGQDGTTEQGSASAQKPAGAVTPEQKAALAAELSSAKAQLESLKTDLDIAQRKYALDEQMYLSKPDYEKDKAGAQGLDDAKEQIAAKQQQIDDTQKKIDDLQAQVDAENSTK